MKLELHSYLAFMEMVKQPPRRGTETARSMDEQASSSTVIER